MVAAARLVTFTESLSTIQTSSRLGVSVTTVGGRRRRGLLYGFPHPHGWRYPTWQFDAGSTIPGLASVIEASPADFSPVIFRALMLAPRPGLADHPKLTSPREWLLDGGNTAQVIELFDVFCDETAFLSHDENQAMVSDAGPVRGSQYERLPSAPGNYRVETFSGTVHIISTLHGTWERRPAPGSQPFHYDYRKAPISSLPLSWEVGGLGHIDVADETYGSGATWHRTSLIVSITDEDTYPGPNAENHAYGHAQHNPQAGAVEPGLAP